MNSILKEIQNEIDALKRHLSKSNVGRVVGLYDGIAKIEGLSKVMYNEKVQFTDTLFGIALSLEEDSVGVVLLGDYSKLKEGNQARSTGELLSAPVGKGLLGRIINPLGEPLDNKGSLQSTEHYPVERVAPGILPRQSVSQPLETGIMAVDSMIPIGRGQRELSIGDRSTGKTTLAIDTLINQAQINEQAKNEDGSFKEGFRPVYSIYVAIGQKQSSIAKTIDILEKRGALAYSTVVVSPAADNAANQYIAPFVGAAIGEWYMHNQMDALIVYDDLSKHAAAYRQLSLVLKRPAGREAYPGDVFYLHSRLLERSARLNEQNGGGSLTALPIIETQAGDVSAYIPTNVISITDGQIFLETDLFNQGVRPAVNVGLSVSRVGSAAQKKIVKQVSGKIKGELAQYRELATFAQFGSDLDAQTKAILEKGSRMVEIFKQPPFSSNPTEVQVAVIWAVQNDFFNDIAPKQIVEFATKLIDYLKTAQLDLLENLRKGSKLEGALEAELRKALEDWKRSL